MRSNYNPFSKKNTIETTHGIINFQHDMGTTYVTHRRPEHVFKKYGAFAISITELEQCYENNVYWVLIMYQNKEEITIPHRIKLENLRFLKQHDNNGDIQVIIPIKHMEKRGEDGWQ